MDSLEKHYSHIPDSKTSLETAKKGYYDGKNLNILAPIEDQCKWLREIGFIMWIAILRFLSYAYLEV